MANLILTTTCNRHCSYCFAGSYLQQEIDPSINVSRQTFEKYLNYLEKSGIHQVRLLGGEPTLHPEFGDFINLASDRGFSILVFSNGLIPNNAIDAILQIPGDRIDVLVNITPETPSRQIELNPKQLLNLKKMNQRAHLGFTISQPDTNALFDIIRIIEETNCSRSVRLGLAHPAESGNDSLSPKHYRRVATGILPFIREARQHSIDVEFDCGFIRCMFSDADISELLSLETNFGWRCSPVIDFLQDGSAIPCFPLSSKFQFPDALDYSEKEVVEHFLSATACLRVVGIFPECSVCLLRVTEKCSGGCLSIAIQRMHKRPMVYEIPEFELQTI